VARVIACCFPQMLPQPDTSGASGCKPEQLLLRETDQRRFQKAGQRQVIVRHQQDAAKRDQILDRDIIAEHQTVDTGDRYAKACQFAHQGMHEVASAAYQEEDVASPDGPSL